VSSHSIYRKIRKKNAQRLSSAPSSGLLKTLYTTTRYYYNKDVQKMVESDRKNEEKEDSKNCPKYFSKNNKNYFQLSISLLFTYFSRKMMQAFLLTHPSANLL